MADSMQSSKPEEANSLLREAAEIFESIGKSDSAARCFVDLGEYERAGTDFPWTISYFLSMIFTFTKVTVQLVF